MPSGDGSFAASVPGTRVDAAAGSPVHPTVDGASAPPRPTRRTPAGANGASTKPRPSGAANGAHAKPHPTGAATNGKRSAPAHRAARTPAGDEDALARLRAEMCARYGAEIKAGAAPIRIMARMVRETEHAARERGLPAEDIAAGIVNRTIGDVDLRHVSPEDDGPEFVSLADDIGIALPGEVIGGRPSSGESYLAVRARMLDVERRLLARGYDARVYDLPAVGNPLLRELLATREAERYGVRLAPECVYLCIGALDGLDRLWRGYAHALRQRGVGQAAVAFPAPGFNVPEWQATTIGLRLHRLYTRVEDGFKITPDMLRSMLDEAPDVRALYLTVSNNPTAFAYTPGELRALFDVLLRADREVMVVADLAYIGTGDPAEDRARMAAFADSGILPRSALVHSLSKTHTLTGDRCGWVGFGDPALATAVSAAWVNGIASLPAEWQLRYTAVMEFFAERPELEARIRDLYTHRRRRLVAQLRRLDARHDLFARINLDDRGTVYNWSQLRPGYDVFSLFERTGIAGVPGGAFGYSDDFVRFSIGCVPVPAL